MAKKKAAKKGGFMGILASIVLVVFAVISIACLSAPLVQVTDDGEPIDAKLQPYYTTAFEFMDKMNEKDDDGVKAIDTLRDSLKEAKEELDKAKEEVKKLEKEGKPQTIIGLAKDSLALAQKAYDGPHSYQVFYDTVLAVEVLAALAIVFGVLGLVMYLVKKGNIGFILNLVAFLLILGVFISACIMMADANAVIKTYKEMEIVAKSVAPAAVLALSLIGTLVGGAFTFVAKKK